MYVYLYFILLVASADATYFTIVAAQPKILSKDGHLEFQAASHKNISFLTSGTGRVHINGVDLTQSAKITDNVVRAMAKYQTSFESSFEKIDRFEKLLEGEDGLVMRINALQDDYKNTSNSSPSMTRGIRRLNRRVMNLERQLTKLQTRLEMNDCQSNPCKHGGTCIDLYNGFICQCPSEWEGAICDVDVNECSRFLGTDLGCQNGASCVNKPGTYECLCTHGWYGIHCTRRSNDCNTGSNAELCGHGTCVPQNNDVGYKCICDQGWTKDDNSPACNKDVDECKMNRPACSPLTTCINLPGTFHCGNCPAGYTGNGFYCHDIDECLQNNGGCSSLVQCINTPGSSLCGNCPPGYEGNGKVCSYQNSICGVNNGGCHSLATCRDNPRISSTFVQCICPPGYFGNGIGPNGCIRSPNFNIHPCNPNPCVHGTCSVSNTTGSYVCTCFRRWLGQNCDVIRDLCVSNPCLNGGTCRSILGISYRCTCPSTHVGLRCENEKLACGGRLQGENGTLVYPSIVSLAQEHNCAWIIETNITKVLNVTFTKFNLEKTRTCQNSWLQIHDGRNTLSPSKGRYCGDELPLGGYFVSTHNFVYLWFRSIRPTTGGSFELNWYSVDPVCGEMITVTSHGAISSPGSPGNYPNNRDCYWTLSAPTGKRIQFHFFTLLIGNYSDCDHDYLEFGNGLLNKPFAKFCNSSHPSPLFSPTPDVLIHFHSDASENYPGFQITYSLAEGIPGCGGVFTAETGEIRSPSYKGYYPADLSCEYRISLSSNLRIKLEFLSFALEDSSRCRYDRVNIYDGPTTDAPLIGRYCGKTIPAPYITGSNQVLITFQTDWASTDEGFVLRYETVCGGKYTASSGIIQSENTIDASSSGTKNCIFEIIQPIGMSITLNFIDFDIYSITNTYSVPCLNNFVEIRDGDNENSTLIGRYCSKAPPPIISSFNYLWVKFQADLIYAGQKFKANYTTTQMGCGGILKEKVGTISSSRESNVYLPSENCKWIISAPPGNVIQIVWMSFHLEDDSQCEYDYVAVYDNNTETGMGGSMGKFCGHTTPPQLLSSSNVVTLHFVTDSSINYEGFLASYSFIDDSNVCGGSYFANAGIIKSPGYPNSYSDNLDCEWKIHAEPGHQIRLNITDFDIEEYDDCRYDWLEIRNGDKSSSPLIGKYCGTNIPPIIPSHANKLYLHFKSDMTKVSKGFKIYWDSTTTGCGGFLNSPTGSIISPHYPEPYPSDLECIWEISVSAGSVIQVVFSDLDLENHLTCNLDYIEFYDGISDLSKSLGKYCSDQIPAVIKSSSNHMTIKFVSDISAEGRGFQLQYTTNCNNTVTGYHGVIESPNFPNRYPHNANCVWDIKVHTHNKINITFSHFDLEEDTQLQNSSTKSCRFDYVEISYRKDISEEIQEVTDEDFIKYDKYCGNKRPDLIALNSDYARIRFVSDSFLVGIGFRLEWQLEGCGGILTKPSGTISSPNYPKAYPMSVVCVWIIRAELGNSVEINFTDIDIEEERSCSYDAIIVRNGDTEDAHEIITFCRQTKPTTVSSTGNLMMIEFRTDSSYQGHGFIGNYTFKPTKCGGKFTSNHGSIMSPNYPKTFDTYDTCRWLVEIDESHVIDLTIEDVDLPLNILNSTYKTGTFLNIYNGPSTDYPILITLEDKQKPNTTLKSSSNQIYIEMVSNSTEVSKGFKLKYHKACGAQIKTSSSGIISFSPLDIADESVYNCTWTIMADNPSKHVTLSITHLDVGYSTCEDENYSISVYGGDSEKSPLLEKYCSNKLPPMLTSGGSALHIVSDTYSSFTATYSVYDSFCGGTLSAFDGSFASPGFPKSYPMNIECEWILDVAEGNHISLTFKQFSLLPSERCNTHYLEIRQTNSSGKLLGVFCNDDSPQNITHKGSLWIYLKTSTSGSVDSSLLKDKGFLAEYYLNTDNELTGDNGIIESPLYPKSIKYHSVFTWRIIVEYSKKIMLEFLEFDLEEYDSSCFMSRLQVYDGSDESSKMIGQYCGLELPKPITSIGNIIFLKAHYFSSRTSTKFRLKWRALSGDNSFQYVQTKKCGVAEIIDLSELKNISTVTSPGYPQGYTNNLKCEWTFRTIPMNHIQIYFKDIRLERSPMVQCFLDYIEIFQKKPLENDWTSIGKICQPNITKPYETTNMMKLTFTTNRFINAAGFSAEVREVCGGSLFEPMGYIFVDNSTYTYYNTRFTTLNCQWNVTVRAGRTIKVTFMNFDIRADSENKCVNYLMLRNGQFPNSPLLGQGKYCGNNVPDSLNTTSNYLYIKFYGSRTESFKIKYEEVAFDCGEEIHLTDSSNFTEITTPNYPNIPNPHIECSWIILAPPREKLRIDFHNRFDLMTSVDCAKEYVEVKDGGTIYSPQLTKSCKDAPTSVYSTDNVMLVKYFTDIDEPGAGFSARISIAQCGGTIRGLSGKIEYNQNKIVKKNKNILCEWKIVGEIDDTLKLTFSEMDTDSSIPCTLSESLYITEKNLVEESVKSYGPYCGSTIPAIIETASNEVTVSYTSTSVDRHSKFVLNFNSSREKCGGVINADSGELRAPKHQRFIRCHWKIQVKEGRRVTFTITDMDMSENVRRREGLAFFNGPNFQSHIRVIEAQSTIRVVKSSENFMAIYYWSNGLTRQGFSGRFTSDEPTVCVGDFSQQAGQIKQPSNFRDPFFCTYSHINNEQLRTNHTFALSIQIATNISSTQTACTYPRNRLLVFAGGKPLKVLCRTTQSSVDVFTPLPLTKVIVSKTLNVQFNYTISFETHDCGGIINGEIGSISSPGYPNKHSKSVGCSWLLNLPEEQQIKLSVDGNFNLGDDCDKNYLEIFNGNLPSKPKIGRYCRGNALENVIISQTNSLWIDYKFDKETGGPGFKLKYEPLINGCGGIFHDRDRVIQTPNYPKQYPNNAECFWQIESAPGYHISLRFSSRFQLEDSEDCKNDRLEIKDWKNNEWVSKGIFCRREIPETINSTGTKLMVRFTSNSDITGGGFRAEWTWQCGGEFEADVEERFIVSPGFPNNYEGNMNCQYHITAPSLQFINIKFYDFNLEGDNTTCTYDNVTITASLTSLRYAHILKQVYCGTATPPASRLSSSAYVIFKTDKYLQRQGFRFSYQLEKGCGGNITQPGTIVSPSLKQEKPYGTPYQMYISCTWNIIAPPKKIIVLQFEKFDLPARQSCYFDNLEVYQDLNLRNRSNNLCGNLNRNLPVIKSKSNLMSLRLRSYRTSNVDGFVASVIFTSGPEEGCGGDIQLSNSSHVLENPDLDFMDCTWTISSPIHTTIKIMLSQMNFVGGCNKSLDSAFLDIKDGYSVISETIEKLCGITDASIQKQYITSSSKAQIRFYAQRGSRFKATLSVIPSICGPYILQSKNVSQILMSPNYPDQYPDNVRCTWLLKGTEKSVLHFIDFDLGDEPDNSTGNSCLMDRLQINDGVYDVSTYEGTGVIMGHYSVSRFTPTIMPGYHQFCGKKLPFDFYTSKETVVLSFSSISTKANRGRGFKLEYREIGCIRNYTNLYGRIINNKFTDCYITITVPSNYTISLFFQHFLLMQNSNCNDMGVEIKDGGKSGRSIFRACGYALPSPIFASNEIWLHAWNKRISSFPSNFDLIYISTDQGKGCGGTIYESKGRFSSPMYPTAYTNDKLCTWNIEVPYAMRVSIQISDFDIQGDCDSNYLSIITDGLNTHKFCKNDEPATLFSNKKMTVMYQSSSSNEGRGWLAQFQAVNEGT